MATTLSLGSTTKPTPTRNLNTALLVIALAQLMVVLDTAIVNIALPSIQRALQFTPTGLEWVVNGYSLAFGGLLLLGGRAGDLLGRRPVFVAGVLLFTAGSLGGALYQRPNWSHARRRGAARAGGHPSPAGTPRPPWGGLSYRRHGAARLWADATSRQRLDGWLHAHAARRGRCP